MARTLTPSATVKLHATDPMPPGASSLGPAEETARQGFKTRSTRPDLPTSGCLESLVMRPPQLAGMHGTFATWRIASMQPRMWQLLALLYWHWADGDDSIVYDQQTYRYPRPSRPPGCFRRRHRRPGLAQPR